MVSKVVQEGVQEGVAQASEVLGSELEGQAEVEVAAGADLFEKALRILSLSVTLL